MTDYLSLPTIPVSWYVDKEVFDWELATIFAEGPEYVGCVPMVPMPGNYLTLERRDHAEMLINEAGKVWLMSNICRHRSLLMLQGQGKVRSVVCPMHLWSYGLDGTLLGAPHYREKPCVSLAREPLQEWNGVLFTGKRNVSFDLAMLSGRPELDISGYVLGQREVEEQPVNWKIPVEILLENYHVPVIHPGLARYTNAESWADGEGDVGEENEWFGYQEFKPNGDFSRNPGSPVWERWQQAILKLNGGVTPKTVSIISLYAPSIFLEWYPFCFVVTTYKPLTPQSSLMTRDFFYDPRALQEMPEFAALTKEAWDENQRADDIAHLAAHRGRMLRHKRAPNDLMGYEEFQHPMEFGVKLFHQQLLRMIGPKLGSASRG